MDQEPSTEELRILQAQREAEETERADRARTGGDDQRAVGS